MRTAAAICLPFVISIWQLQALIFVPQTASAGFTPVYQATIPEVLADAWNYASALPLSPLAYDLDSVTSPAPAAVLLVFLSFDTLFFGTSAGFVASALLVASVGLPTAISALKRPILDRTTRALRAGLFIVNTGCDCAGEHCDSGASRVSSGGVLCALALGSFGVGSILTPLAIRSLLNRWPDRPIMLFSAALIAFTSMALTVCSSQLGLHATALFLSWLVLGVAFSEVMTPSVRLVRRSGPPEVCPALFAPHFTLSHACWLIRWRGGCSWQRAKR